VSGIANVTSPPYDVISGGGLAHLRAADPHNVVRLILPGGGKDAPALAARLLAEWMSDGVLIRDRTPAFYLYEQSAPSWRQRGIVGLVRLGSPDSAGILPHEGVMPGPVAGRRQLMAATEANLEPIFLVYDGGRGERDDESSLAACGPTATEIVDRVADGRTPLLSIQTEDGVTHRLWRLDDPAECGQIAADLAERRALIADGHHRYAAYLQLQAELRAAGRGDGPWDYGLAFLVDSAACPPRLGAIHRVLPGLALDRASDLAAAAFAVNDLAAGTDLESALGQLAAEKGTAFLLAGNAADGGNRYRLLSQPDPAQTAASMPPGASPPWQGLDASILQQLLLGRLWGITDNEDDVLIYHDAADAVSAAGDGTAVILNPVPFEAVREIAEHGERVPRKSTSFGPKPRTGLVLRTFGPYPSHRSGQEVRQASQEVGRASQEVGRASQEVGRASDRPG
jgi:uncharacterized protein (DUF1015 family)